MSHARAVVLAFRSAIAAAAVTVAVWPLAGLSVLVALAVVAAAAQVRT